MRRFNFKFIVIILFLLSCGCHKKTETERLLIQFIDSENIFSIKTSYIFNNSESYFFCIKNSSQRFVGQFTGGVPSDSRIKKINKYFSDRKTDFDNGVFEFALLGDNGVELYEISSAAVPIALKNDGSLKLKTGESVALSVCGDLHSYEFVKLYSDGKFSYIGLINIK